LVVCTVGPLETPQTTTTTSRTMSYSTDNTSSAHAGQGDACVYRSRRNLYNIWYKLLNQMMCLFMT